MVNDCFPEGQEGDEEHHNGSRAPLSYTDIFYQSLPFYMSIGMTYDEFWHGDCCLTKYYREAFEIKQDRENQRLWLQGRYVYDALCEAAPLFRFSMKGGKIEPLPYTEQPYPRTEKQARELQRRKEKEQMEKMRADMEAKMVAWNKQFEKQEVIDDG